MKSPLSIAIGAALGAGEIIRDAIGSHFAVKEKEGLNNFVTEIDHRSEEFIIHELTKAFPGDGILCEEGGAVRGNDESHRRWHVDPLDGTVNFVHGIPLCCVSIGLEVGGVVECGVIYHPHQEELFTAERGKGARLNGKPLSVTATTDVSRGCFVTGFPYNIRENPDHVIERFVAMIHTGSPIRRLGSAAIDLAWVAAGRFDGFWEGNLNSWDVAAGSLLVSEAGGALTTYSGEPYSIYSKNIVASNGKVHEAMRKVITAV